MFVYQLYCLNSCVDECMFTSRVWSRPNPHSSPVGTLVPRRLNHDWRLFPYPDSQLFEQSELQVSLSRLAAYIQKPWSPLSATQSSQSRSLAPRWADNLITSQPLLLLCCRTSVWPRYWVVLLTSFDACAEAVCSEGADTSRARTIRRLRTTHNHWLIVCISQYTEYWAPCERPEQELRSSDTKTAGGRHD